MSSLDLSPKALQMDFVLRAEKIGAGNLAPLVAERTRYLNGGAGDPLAARWYDSLAAGSPDYRIYEGPEYLVETWVCWSAYARKYLRGLRKSGLLADLAPSRIADLGCGLGYSTRALAEMFPGAEVVGTNVADSLQWKFAKTLGSGFELAPALWGSADLVFASEFFEHLRAPVTYLHEVIDEAQPAALLVANSFGTFSPGHFDTYLVGGAEVGPAATSRAFGAALRDRGYRRAETGFWNNRPALWRRSG